MSMEIAGIVGQGNVQRSVPGDTKAQRMPTLNEQAALHAEKSLSSEATGDEIATLLDDLQGVASALNTRLKFSMNRELGEVVVKVIDRQTDKVIKELPPKEIQRLHVRIREAIGLLIDEEI